MAKQAIIVLGAIVIILGILLIRAEVKRSDLSERYATLGQEFEEKRNEYTTGSTRLQLVLKDREARILDLKQKERDFDRAQEELKALEESAAKAQAQSDAERAKAAALSAQIEDVRAERDKIARELDAQLKVHAEVAPQLAAAKQAAEAAAAELEKTKKEKAAVAEELAVAEAESKKNLEEIEKIRRLARDVVGDKIVGKVEENVGSGKIILSELSEKPEVGLEFSIFRDSEFIARARVYRVLDKFAGARITFLQKGKVVEPGDVVRTGF